MDIQYNLYGYLATGLVLRGVTAAGLRGVVGAERDIKSL
jgi:hypothetical protein